MKKACVCLFVMALLVTAVACGNAETTTSLETTQPSGSTTADGTSSTVETSTTVTPAVTTSEVTTATVTTAETEVKALLDQYDLATYMMPIWEGDTVYQESVMFVGKDDKAPLLYTPTEIISVRSSDLKKEYKEGVDWVLEDGKLTLPEGSSIPVMAIDEYYPQNNTTYGCFGSNLGSQRPFVRWGEEDTFTKFQVFVSYRHEELYSGFLPKGQSGLYPKTLAKLHNGETLNVVFYGDSITEGYNTSGFIKKAPYADRWSEMVTGKLSLLYPKAEINCINTGVAGKDSVWAIQNMKTSVVDKDPDLVILAFGMNDGGVAPATLAQRMVNLARSIKNQCKDCEILLVSTMLPNKEAAGFWGNQYLFEDAMLTAAKTAKLGVVQMGSLHASLLEKKPYYHMTGNNINHPNDFLARLYAQSIVEALIGEETK